jgi:NADPH-dependent ferric siderophore reductase
MPRTRRETKTFPINVRELVVSRVRDVSPGMRRITLTGAQLRGFTTADGIRVPPLRSEGFDDHVKLVVPGPGQERPVPPVQVEGHLDWSPPGGRPTAKDYTPRRWDPEAGELDLDLVRHGTGAAARWADRVRPGDPAHIAGPKSSAMLPEGVDWLLVAGDETALPAIGRLVEELPDGLPAQVFVEVAGPDHRLPLAERSGVEVTWLYRDGAEPGTTDLLERAVRTATWWPGEVFAWIAGEAGSVKPIRSHLKLERGVAPDCLEVTGYWRRTAVAADGTGAMVEEDDQDATAYERLEALSDLTGPSALRAAVTVGLLARLERGAAPVAELADELRLAERPLRALLRYLAARDVVAPDPADPACTGGAPVALGPVGDLLVEEDDALSALDQRSGAALLELSPARVVELLVTGRAAPAADGRPVAEVLAADGARAADLRARRGEESVWSSPSVAAHHDWSRYGTVTLLGAGAPETAATLLHENPALRATVVDLPSVLDAVRPSFDASVADRVTWLPGSPLAPLPPVEGAVLVTHLLDQLTDADAVFVLRGLGAALGGADLLVAELVLDPDEEADDHDADLDLRLWTAFGSGTRTPAELERLFATAGLTGLAAAGGQDLGWDMRLWVLSA